jgi:TP901 family phage tail tape measure protein
LSIDVTSLSISVTSTGIKEAATALEAFSNAASKVEGKTKTIKEATSGLSASQQASVAGIEKLIAGFQKQADLLGANTSQMNAYAVAMKSGTQLEQAMASMLGAEVDAYRAKGIAQQQAIKDNQALDASYKKLQTDADAYYAAQAKAQAAGNALNQAGQREQEMKKIAAAQKELTRTTNELAAADARQKATQQSRDIEMRAMSYNKLAAAQAEALAMNRALDAEQARIKSIEQARQVELHAQAYNKLAAAQAEAIKMNNAYDASLRRLSQDEAARKQSLFNSTLQQGHDLARGLSGSLGALWLTYGNIGMMIAGVAIGASLKEAVTGFAKVEYQMTFVKALAEDTTHSVTELTARMHDVAGALGIAPEAAAKGLRALTQAGLNTADALATLPVAFKLATVGELALESAALAATGVMNAYDLKVSNLEHIGDVMAKAGAMSAASVDSISVSMKYSAGTAEQYGVSLEKLGTILTLLGKRGITGSSAGVAANNLIAELYSPSSEKAIKAAAALGVKAYVDGVRQPIEEVVASFKDSLGKFDSQSQGMLLEAMFGKKGGKAFYAVAQGTKEDFQAMETQLVNSTGFVADVYKANLKTVEGQLNLTKSAITNMFAKVGEESSAPIKDLLVSIRNMASSQAAQDMFIGLTQSIKTFVTTIVPAALTVGAFFAAAKVGTVVVAGWTAAMAFLESTIAIGLIPTIKALNIAMLSNPIGLLVGLVTTLAGAYFLLKRNKESVHDLHKKDMDQAAETLKAGNEEITMLEKQLTLRGQNIRGDGEQAAIKEMQANEAVMAIRNRMMENNTKYYTELGKSKNAGSFNASGPKENIQLEKDLVEAEKTYSALAAQNKNIQDLKKRLRDEDKRMDAEDLANATPKVAGTQKYGGNDKGAKAAASDEYAAAIAKEHDIIKASKTAMQNFEDTQNNLFKAGEIGKLKFIQEVGNKQAEELAKQHKAIDEQISIAAGKKNGKADTQKFTDDLAANELAAKTAKIKTAEETNVQLAQYAQENTRFQIQELETQGKFGAAAALKFSSENKLAFKQAEQDIADFGDKFPIITERLKQLGAARDAAIASGNNKEALAAFNTEADKTRNILKGVQTASEGQGLAAMFDAARDASAKYAAELPTLKLMMADITDPKGQEEATARMANNADNYRKMWIGVGDSISKSLKDAFGKSGQAVGDLIKVAQNYADLDSKTDSARIKAYGDAAGAAKGFFKAGTTGYKLLEGAERAFRLVELAGMAQSLATSLTTDSAKAAGKAPAVLMEFMSWLGPWGMAAGGAAIAAVLGGAFSGGGVNISEQRQKTQGTGSVLGSTDAKSDSIANSITILEKNSGLGLAHSSTMIGYLKTVADGISGLAAAVAQAAGVGSGKIPGIVENTPGFFQTLFGASKTTVKDQGITAAATSLGNAQQGGINASSYADVEKSSWWGLSKSNSTTMNSLGADVNNRIKLIIDSMAKTVTAAADSLGMGGDAFTEHLKTFIVDIGTISTKGMSGDEIEKAFSAVFSKVGDDMATFALPVVTQFQKVNEGLLETVSRLANDLVQVKDVFAVLNKTFNLTGISAITASENLITAAGGLDKLTSGTKFFVDNFLTEAEKMEPITASVAKRMKELGYAGVTTIDDFKKLVRGLDLTDPAAQQLYGSLIDIAPAFKDAADYALKLADNTKALADSQKLIDDARSNLDAAYQRESTALQGVIDKFKAFSDMLKKFKDSLLTGAMSTLSPEQKYLQSKSKFESTSALAAKGDSGALADLQNVSQQFLDASRGYNASTEAYARDFDAVQKGLDSSISAADQQTSIAQSQLNVMKASYEALVGIQTLLSFKDASSQYQGASSQGIEGLYGSILGRHSDAAGMAYWQKQLANGMTLDNISQLMKGSQEKIDGSHAGGLNFVPKDNYLANLHKGERVQTAAAANASDKNSAELVTLTKELLTKISKLEEHSEASNTQRGAVAEQSAEQMEKVVEGLAKVARKVAA